jgi:hypothetical protein
MIEVVSASGADDPAVPERADDRIASIVQALLSSAQLEIPDDERDEIVRDYSLLRSQADALFAAPSDVQPAMRFNPFAPFLDRPPADASADSAQTS